MRIVKSIVKYDIDKFDEKNNFGIWRTIFKAFLVMQGLWKVVEGSFPSNITDKEKANQLEQALSAIFMIVIDKMLQEIVHKTNSSEAWKKLE